MSRREFDQQLKSLNALSPEQLATFRRELDSKMSLPLPAAAKRARKRAQQTVFNVMLRSGSIGCRKGMPHTPTDLGTNLKHMEGFGRLVPLQVSVLGCGRLSFRRGVVDFDFTNPNF